VPVPSVPIIQFRHSHQPPNLRSSDPSLYLRPGEWHAMAKSGLIAAHNLIAAMRQLAMPVNSSSLSGLRPLAVIRLQRILAKRASCIGGDERGEASTASTACISSAPI